MASLHATTVARRSPLSVLYLSLGPSYAGRRRNTRSLMTSSICILDRGHAPSSSVALARLSTLFFSFPPPLLFRRHVASLAREKEPRSTLGGETACRFPASASFDFECHAGQEGGGEGRGERLCSQSRPGSAAFTEEFKSRTRPCALEVLFFFSLRISPYASTVSIIVPKIDDTYSIFFFCTYLL